MWELSQAGFNAMFIDFYQFDSKQETELLIPAQTGNRTMNMCTSIERMLSVDH